MTDIDPLAAQLLDVESIPDFAQAPARVRALPSLPNAKLAARLAPPAARVRPLSRHPSSVPTQLGAPPPANRDLRVAVSYLPARRSGAFAAALAASVVLALSAGAALTRNPPKPALVEHLPQRGVLEDQVLPTESACTADTVPTDGEPADRVSSAPAESNAPRTSLLRVPDSVNGLLVDGTPQRVTGGAVFVTCGRHRIKLPMHSSRSIDVPCGRTVSL